MSTTNFTSDSGLRTLDLGDALIPYQVNRGRRTKARLVVSPNGKVEVRVPAHVSDEWIDAFVSRRRHWVIRQRQYFDQFRPREPDRRYVNGETVRYLGRQYTLKLVTSPEQRARLLGRHLVASVPETRDAERVRGAVQSWYRARAQDVFARRAERCKEIFAPHGVRDPDIVLRSMRRRWGSCTRKGRVLLNPYLVIAPTDCIDYVIIHEMCHLKRPRHDEAFYRLLSTVMPDWSLRRRRLEKFGPYLTF